MSLKTTLTRAVGKQVLTMKTHSPALLIGAGVVGFVGTVGLSIRATLKLDEAVLQDAEKEITRIKETTLKRDGGEYTDSDRKKELASVYVTTTLKAAKLYAPAVILGVASIAALTGSHIILSRRNVGLAAAYKTVDEAFKKYRERVVADQGEEKDREYRHGVVEREIVEDTPEGPVVKTVKTFDADGVSGYARKFAKGNTRNWRSDPAECLHFIRMQQDWLNDKLQSHGFLYLSDVYDDLGFKQTPESRVVGWVLGKGDDFVDFGISDNESEKVLDFYMGREGSLLLDFNVTGPILDLMPIPEDK